MLWPLLKNSTRSVAMLAKVPQGQFGARIAGPLESAIIPDPYSLSKAYVLSPATDAFGHRIALTENRLEIGDGFDGLQSRIFERYDRYSGLGR